MSSRIKAYPWSEAKGLCKILRDPAIWGSSFPKLEARQVVKGAAKKTPAIRNLPQVRVFNVTDDEAFGSIVIEVLASPTGRKELDKEFARRFAGFQLRKSLASRLYDHHLTQHVDRIPSSEEIFEKRQDSPLHFVPEKFAAWLARKELSAEDQRILSLYACYFALRWPEQAEAIREVLVNHDVVFLNWLSAEEVAPENPPTQIPQPLPEPIKTNAQAEPQGITTPVIVPETVSDEKPLSPQITAPPPDSAELVHLLTSYGEWDRDLPIDQLRRAVSLLMRKAERHTDRLHELDEIQGRITNYLKEEVQPIVDTIDAYRRSSPGIRKKPAVAK